METTESRAVMPMTTPSTVRNERILFSRRVLSAILAFSPMVMLMGASDLLPQSFDRLQTGRFSRGIDAEEKANRGGNNFGAKNRGKRHRHGNGSGGGGQQGDGVGE